MGPSISFEESLDLCRCAQLLLQSTAFDSDKLT